MDYIYASGGRPGELPMFRLSLLGAVTIEGPDGVVTGRAARRHPLALLALLALSHARRLSRDKLIGHLWPERDSSGARNLLNQSVHALRQALGEGAIRSEGDELALNPETLSCDVWTFEEALESGDVERAVAHYRGPFVDGFFLPDSLEFERWADGERERLRRSYRKALEELAERAAARGELEAAAEWWRRLAAEEPYDSSVTLRFMQTLESAGDRVAAIREAEAHAQRLREDLDAAPNPAVLALAERMRTQPIGPGLAPAPPDELGHERERQVQGAGLTGARSLVREVHRRALWQVALFYIGGVWACYEIIAAITERLALPTWLPVIALILFVLGLPSVLATAFVQEGGPLRGRVDPPEKSDSSHPLLSRTRGWLTWRKSITGGVLAFTLLGLTAAGYMTMPALGIGPLATLLTKGVLEERDVIVLADFKDNTGDSTLALTVTEAFRVDLVQSRVVSVADRDYVGQVLQRMERESDAAVSYDVAREVAIRDGLKAVVSGEINRAGSGFVLSARLVAAETGEELHSLRETATDLDAIIPAIDRLSRRLRGRIGESLRTIRDSPPLSQARTASLEALRFQTEAFQANLRGDYARALDLLDRAIEIDTLFAAAYRARSSVLGNLGINRAQRVADATKAYELRQRLPLWERYWVEADYANERGEYTKVIEAYSRLLERRDYPGAVQNLGQTYEELRQYAQAEELFHRRLEMDSLAGTSWVTLARVQFNQGKFDEAEETLRRFEAKLPEHPSISVYRARFASARGDYDAAEQYLRNWRDGQSMDPLRKGFSNRYLAHLAQLKGRLSEAESLLLDAMSAYEELGLAATYLETEIELAHLRMWLLGDTARALESMTAALEKAPVDSIEPLERPYVFLAEFYAYAGALERARRLLSEWETVVLPDLGRPHEEVIRRSTLAALALAEGRAADAVTEYRSALERDSYPVWRFAMLGRAYETAGQPDSAVALYERYLTTPFFARTIAGFAPAFGSEPYWLALVYERLGDLYAQRADTARAIHYYGKLVELWEDADPELQPRVDAARRAIEALSQDR